MVEEKADEAQWVKCPSCSWKLCKRVEKGLYEMKNRKGGRRGKVYAANIRIGSIRCPSCGAYQHIPPSDLSAFEAPKEAHDG